MKILYASKTPLAGVCELMCRIVNEYTEHEARVLNRGPGKHAWYCRPPEKLVPRYNIRDADQARTCLAWADVIHCMANVGARNISGGISLLRKKVWVFQWHGAQIWPFEQVWKPADYRHVRWIHIGQGWIERQMEFFGPFIEDFGMEVIPNLITANDELHVPLDDEKRSTHVVFAPSTVNPNAPNPKGVEEVKRACKAYGLTLDVVFRKSFEECMMRKQRAMVGVDEVITGMYHRSGLEFLSQGVPCFTALNEFGETALKKATGADWVPFEKTTPKELGRDMRALLHDGDLRRGQGRKARQWIETYYAPQVLIERHLEVYKR